MQTVLKSFSSSLNGTDFTHAWPGASAHCPIEPVAELRVWGQTEIHGAKGSRVSSWRRRRGSFGFRVSPVQKHVNSHVEESSDLGEETATWMVTITNKSLLALARHSTGDRKWLGQGGKAAGGTFGCCCHQDEPTQKKAIYPKTRCSRLTFLSDKKRVVRSFFDLIFLHLHWRFWHLQSRQTERHLMDLSTRTGKAARQAPEAETAEHIPLWHRTDERLVTEQKKNNSFLVEVSLTGELCELCEITWVVKKKKKNHHWN